MRLKLLRPLGINFDCQSYILPEEWSSPEGLVVRLLTPPHLDPANRRTILVVAAERMLTEPLGVDTEGAIRIPPDLRREQEKAIEDFANIWSVVLQCKRSLFSFDPFIAIEPLDEEAEAWLASARCIHVPLVGVPPRMSHDLSAEEAHSYLVDRLDGVALIAEAMCHAHPSGRLHEFMRLFERAFASAAGRVCRHLLPAFLAHLGQGYTDHEIRCWLNLRDRSAHADRQHCFAVEADTRPVVARMEQAAYDVLFNKLVWRAPSLGRRSVYYPICGSLSGTGSAIFATQGKPLRFTLEILDGFGAYPQNVNFSFRAIPPTWFTKTSAHHHSMPSEQGFPCTEQGA